MTGIATHQDLLDEYVLYRLYSIGETSGDFSADWRELIADVERYADAHGLSTSCLDYTRDCLASDGGNGG